MHLALRLCGLHLQVTDGALQHRIPIDQALAPVNQSLLVEPHKSLGHRCGQLGVHGEVLAAPVHAVTHAAHLRGDGVAGLFFPFPDLGDEVLARLSGRRPHVVAADALALQLPLHHDLRGNACVVGARYPRGVEARHTVVTRQAVHDGLVERMPHVQRAGHVGRGQLDSECRRIGLGRSGSPVAGAAVAALFPFRAPMRLQRGGLERFGKRLQRGLLGRGVGHGVGKRWGPLQEGGSKAGHFTGGCVAAVWAYHRDLWQISKPLSSAHPSCPPAMPAWFCHFF